jgi:nucleobase:cation symporter-1, NCS1 family
MTTGARTDTPIEEIEGALLSHIEVHSIDWIPDPERHFFVRHGHYAITDIFRLDGVYHRWGWRGLTAYFAGFVAEIPFMMLPKVGNFEYTGYFPGHLFNGVDYSWVAGLIISGLVYLLLSRTLDRATEQAAIEASERELAAIDAAVAA